MINFLNKYLFSLLLGVLLVCTFLTYFQVRNFEFLNYDDNEYITENYALQKGLNVESIQWSFFAYHSNNWHPLTWISHLSDISLFGFDSGKHHLVNVFFHLLNTVLLACFFLAATKQRFPALLVALLFALHPLHVESVAWIAERKDMLSTFFMLIAWLVYYFYQKSRGWQKIISYLVLMVVFILGLMSKQMLVTLPAVLLLFDFWPFKRITKQNFGYLLLEKIPLVILSCLAAYLTLAAQGSFGAVRTLDSLPLLLRMQNAIVAYLVYLVKFIWPSGLVVFYPFSYGFLGLKALLALVGLVGITFWVVKNFKNREYLGVGWFYYLGTLVPVIGIVQVGDQAMADRYAYITLIGIFVMLAFGLDNFINKRFAVNKKSIWIIILSILLPVLVVLTSRQVSVWRDSMTIFEHQIKHQAPSPLILNNLALAYKDKNMIQKARETYELALKINPTYFSTLNNLGTLLSDEGDIQGSIFYYLKAIEAEPENSSIYKIYNNLGIAEYKKGNFEKAIYFFEKALDLQPGYDMTYNNLGVAKEAQGLYQEAIFYYRQGLKINPRHLGILNNLALVYGKSGDYQKSEETFLLALSIDPNFVTAQENLRLLKEFQKQ